MIDDGAAHPGRRLNLGCAFYVIHNTSTITQKNQPATTGFFDPVRLSGDT
jgi:hypothetical protein